MYFCVLLFFVARFRMFTLFSVFIASQAATCTHSYQVSDCAEGRCEEINGHELCTECRADGYIPFNGYCLKYDSSRHSSCKNADGTDITIGRTCGMCTGPMHLYKGGCYSCGSIYPGSLICKECGNGVCTSCTSNFFQNPSASKTLDSCIRCDDTTGVSGLAGVANCLRCKKPPSDSNVAKCYACKSSTHKPNVKGNVCYRCITPDCLRCKDNNVCEACGNFKYLKGTARPYCVSACGVGFYGVSTPLLRCEKCSSTCRACEGPTESECTACHESENYFLAAINGVGKCISCGDEQGYAGWTGVANCKICSPPSDPGLVVCHVCETGYSLIGGECKADCDDFSGNCAVDSCHITIGDKNFCSLCKAEYAPINGICTDVQSGHASGCVSTEGKCSMCGSGYFLYYGGCYNGLDDTYKAICMEIGTGTDRVGLCKTCANGFKNNNGICEHCRDPHCKACNSDASTCETCLDGYYDPRFCSRCHNTCKTCIEDGPKRCLTCSPGKYLRVIYENIGMCVDDTQCGYGTYADSSSQKCMPCSVGCLTCSSSGSDKCTSCPIRTHFLNVSGGDSGRCVECGDTTTTKGVANCQECSVENGSVKCLVCKTGHELVDGNCQSHCQDSINCAMNSCVVGIGEDLYCKLCNTDGHAPINGVCTDIAMENPSGCVLGTSTGLPRSCLQCGAGYFLYMGGCYQENTQLGKSICVWVGVADTINKNNYGPGLCNVCVSGYENQNGVCRPCDTANCEQCHLEDQVEVCTHCMLGYILDQMHKCSTQITGSCKVPYCAVCADELKCQQCGLGFFLTSVGTCVDNCKSIPKHYTIDATENTPAKCALCNIPNCKQCSTSVLCAVCSDGYFSDNGVCVRCNPECVTCVAKDTNSCVSCPRGYAILSGTLVGKCEKPCDSSTVGCSKCDANIDGASYCSACNKQTAFPLNGQCAESLSRQMDSACISVIGGACEKCANGYFLLSGGCYQVATYPGRTVCHTDKEGVCIKGAHGKVVSASGVLKECPTANCAECTENSCVTCMVGHVNVDGHCQKCAQGCVACTAPNDSQMCTLCDTGYYQSTAGSVFTCTACSKSNNGMTGVSGCTYCVPPVSRAGTVLCYSFDVLPSLVPVSPASGSSSTAIIAGVSTAAIFVIGSLTGFLMWWFLCRSTQEQQARGITSECRRPMLLYQSSHSSCH